MRKWNTVLLVCATVIIFAQSAYAAVQTDESLPVYPGGKVAIELNFTNKDFLPAIRECITLIPTFMSAALAPGINMSEGNKNPAATQLDAVFAQANKTFIPELQAAIANLNHVSVVAYMVPEKVKGDQISDFYMQKMGLSKGWMRSITANDPKGSGFLRVYAKPNLEGIFGVATQNSRVLVFRTQGKIDLAAIMKLSGKLVPIFISTFTYQPTTPIPEQSPTASGRTGSLRVYSSDIDGMKAVSGWISVIGNKGNYSNETDGKPVTLPVGEYELNRFRLIPDSEKSGLTLFGSSKRKITIEDNEQAEFDISGPLKLEITRMIGAAKQTSTISWKINVGDIAYIDNIKGNIEAPVVKFFDEKNTLLGTAIAAWDDSDTGGYSVSIPALPVGRYRFEVAFNIGSNSEPLTASAELKVRDFDLETYRARFEAYKNAPRSGDTTKLSNARLELLACFQQATVKPGKVVKLADKNQVSEGALIRPDRFSGTLKWYPEADILRIKVDVIDAFYSIHPNKQQPWEASSVEVLFCPFNNGRWDVTQFIFIPEGSGGEARVFPENGRGVTATWKRTKKGYAIEAGIPWSAITGYEKGSPILPLQAQINTRTPNGRGSLVMTPLGEPWAIETYGGLRLTP